MRHAGGAVLAMALIMGVITASAPAVSVDVAGPEQIVFDNSTMPCFFNDNPDGTARAFRDASGRVQLGVRGPETRMIGPTLDNLTHDCTVVMDDHRLPAPWDYDDADWLGGTWTDDGQNIYALVHAEYHPKEHPGWCDGDPVLRCRYNAVTFARSTDGGESFDHAAGPDWLVAAVPYRSVPGDGRYGYFAPSNIVEKDGWKYSLLLVSAVYREQRAGTCLMRTQNPADPKSWRAWDGDGFNVKFIDPYRESPEPVARHVCQPVSYDRIRDMNRSVTWNTYLNKFILTGTSNKYDASQGRTVTGFYYSTSDDLIEWTDRELIMEHETQGTYLCGDQNPRAYPAILDPDSTDRNFGTADQHAYLYFSEILYENCQLRQRRNMIRVPIDFSP